MRTTSLDLFQLTVRANFKLELIRGGLPFTGGFENNSPIRLSRGPVLNMNLVRLCICTACADGGRSRGLISSLKTPVLTDLAYPVLSAHSRASYSKLHVTYSLGK